HGAPAPVHRFFERLEEHAEGEERSLSEGDDRGSGGEHHPAVEEPTLTHGANYDSMYRHVAARVARGGAPPRPPLVPSPSRSPPLRARPRFGLAERLGLARSLDPAAVDP